MKTRNILGNCIRGWFPQEPIIGNKQLQIKLETNPLKLKQLKAKFTINTAQFVTVILAVGMLLSGLYLNSIQTKRTESYLPMSWTTYNEAFEFEGNNYNCCIHMKVVPQTRSMGIGNPNIAPINVYISQPSNLTAGVCIERLSYLGFNSTSESYYPKEVNETRTFSPVPTRKEAPAFSIIDLSVPFEEGQSRAAVITSAGFSLYCNSTGNLPHPLFTITSPIDTTQNGYIINYPYRTYATILLTLGVISLIAALVISFVSLRKKQPNSLYNVLRS
ncbi:MAG TPA: hypothetical protein VLH35_02755 [Candidatus Acidoferrales bacterium]|nr:hypothetical protein [Candidatus Acidoferrales bacterium]